MVGQIGSLTLTRNNADFHGITISHGEENSDGEIIITAHHQEHGEVGRMVLGPPHGNLSDGGREVLNVEVPREHQRKGIARAMWNYAGWTGLSPEHSRYRSDSGDAWARSVGGILPERVK